MRTIRLAALVCLFAFGPAVHVPAQQTGPTDPKAQKTFADANSAHTFHDALGLYRKADKQDAYHCIDCALRAAQVAFLLEEQKQLREEVMELDALRAPPGILGEAHYWLGASLLRSAQRDHKEAELLEADRELRRAMAPDSSKRSLATYADALVLANLHQDEAAKAEFATFMRVASPGSIDYVRAERFYNHPGLARERMAPAFAVTTLQGESVSLDGLAGQVVLIDFWATWCGPCRQTLPHLQSISKRFAGQPLVILSISLDKDEGKWKEFVAKNNMDWPQYRDGGFGGPLSVHFGVSAIPAIFTIDANGVLQDQHVGDAFLEGKLKKLIAEASQDVEASRNEAKVGDSK